MFISATRSIAIYSSAKLRASSLERFQPLSKRHTPDREERWHGASSVRIYAPPNLPTNQVAPSIAQPRVLEARFCNRTSKDKNKKATLSFHGNELQVVFNE